jgi:NAD(P)-dependent dehydrogenase (short-subunit alcohol dehydrogenase family)
MKILITGCTRGIGKSVCELYKSKNNFVIGCAKNTSSINFVDEYIQCDLADDNSIEEFCKIIKSKDIDVLINNAGINIVNDFCEIDPKDFKKIQQVNLYAPFRISQSVLPHMIKKQWGRIVNVSSVWGKISKQGRASYSASKFGIDGMTVSMANEFANQGILCNSVAPGFIDTELTWNNLGIDGVSKILENVPIKRLAKTEEVARLIYMLGSEDNTYISGQNIAIDGGFTRA